MLENKAKKHGARILFFQKDFQFCTKFIIPIKSNTLIVSNIYLIKNTKNNKDC